MYWSAGKTQVELTVNDVFNLISKPFLQWQGIILLGKCQKSLFEIISLLLLFFFSQMQMDFHIIIIHIFFIFKTSAPLVGVVFSALQVVFFYSPEMMQ